MPFALSAPSWTIFFQASELPSPAAWRRSGLSETATADEIVAFCAERLAPYKVPKQVEFRSDLPKTQVGKFLRRVLVEEEKKKLGK